MFEKCASDCCHDVKQQLRLPLLQEFSDLVYSPPRERCFVINMGLNLGYIFSEKKCRVCPEIGLPSPL